MTDFKFALGETVQDKITGFSGIVVARSQWLNNCNTYGIQSLKLEGGKPMDKIWFDEPQLQFLESKKIESRRETGGPTTAVPQTNR